VANLAATSPCFPSSTDPVQRIPCNDHRIFGAVPGCRIRTWWLRKRTLFHTSSMHHPRKVVISFDAARLINSAFGVAPRNSCLAVPGASIWLDLQP
jgi:hypothetical protein